MDNFCLKCEYLIKKIEFKDQTVDICCFLDGSGIIDDMPLFKKKIKSLTLSTAKQRIKFYLTKDKELVDDPLNKPVPPSCAYKMEREILK